MSRISDGKVLSLIRRITNNKGYALLAVLIALFFYSLNVLFANLRLLISFVESSGLPASLMLAFRLLVSHSQTMGMISYLLLVLTSMLIGILFSLVVYRIRKAGRQMRNTSLLSVFAILFSGVASGCTSCGLSIASALGLGSFIAGVLPYKGLEISFLVVAVLIIAIAKTLADMKQCRECSVTEYRGADSMGEAR